MSDQVLKEAAAKESASIMFNGNKIKIKTGCSFKVFVNNMVHNFIWQYDLQFFSLNAKSPFQFLTVKRSFQLRVCFNIRLKKGHHLELFIWALKIFIALS